MQAFFIQVIRQALNRDHETKEIMTILFEGEL